MTTLNKNNKIPDEECNYKVVKSYEVFDECAFVSSITWTVNGIKHNEYGPAYTEYTFGPKIIDEYWLNGKLHRSRGPAKITYFGNHEEIDKEYYYYHGTQITKEDQEKMWTDIMNNSLKIDLSMLSTNVQIGKDSVRNEKDPIICSINGMKIRLYYSD